MEFKNSLIEPKVSVVVGTYNHENYIQKCLDGILYQECNFLFEIILGEDESIDNTRSICKEYAAKYPDKIRLFLRERNNVIYINGNPTGRYNFIENLKSSKSKYLALCDGDDYWTDLQKLQKQVDFMEAHPTYAGCFHDTHCIHEKDTTVPPALWRNYDRETYTLKDTLSTVSLFHTSSFLFRREALQLPSWFSEIQSADMALFAIIASQGLLHRIDAPMSVYRKNHTGITNAIKQQEYHTNRITLFSYLDEFLKGKEHAKIKEVIDFHQGNLKKLQPTSLKNRIKKFLKP